MAKIISLGEYIPDNIRRNEDWSPEMVESFKHHLSRELVDVQSEADLNLDPYTLEGFKEEAGDPFLGGIERRIAPIEVTTLDGELAAAKMAVKNSGIDPTKIGVVYSGSTIAEVPNCPLAYKIGQGVGATDFYGADLYVACASGLIQLEAASTLIDAGVHKYILLTQSHFMSRGIPMGHPASPCIGDAASAILLGPNDHPGHKFLSLRAQSHAEYYESVIWRRKEGTQAWFIGGEDYYLGSFDKRGARDLVLNTIKFGSKTTLEALDKISLTANSLDFFVSVNPRYWIPFGMVKNMGLTEDKTLSTFKKYGHFGGAGPWINLQEAEKTNRLKTGDIVGVYAQGAGFTRASVILEW